MLLIGSEHFRQGLDDEFSSSFFPTRAELKKLPCGFQDSANDRIKFF